MSPSNLTRAQGHVSTACTLGTNIEIIKADTKDETGSALTETVLTLKAFPIRLSPYPRDVSQKIGWVEDTDILAYCSKKTIYDLGYEIENLRRYFKKMRVDKKSYDIRYIEFYSQFANDWLYIIFGGKR
jgi:hypothetical protein